MLPSPESPPAGFAELHPPLSADQAQAAASRCLCCWDAPCSRACPTAIDVPRFLRQILHHDPQSAAATILDANILGGSCARVCPTAVLCEGACVASLLHGRPIPIGLLQRFATDHARDRGRALFAAGEESGRRVAVVGSGPAGLSCAFELRRRGHAVTIFEARQVPGGLNTLGIAAYKITTEFALEEVRRVTALGVSLRLGTAVDGAALRRLREGYDAVFLGLGLGPTRALGIAGEEALWEGLDFVFQTHEKELAACEVGRRVVVIGGGNTAIDCAVAAKRLGAEEVTVAYRRSRAEMPAYQHEVELALAAGVSFVWQHAPVAAILEAGRLCGLRLQRLAMSGPGRQATLEPVAGSERTLACDMAIKALGQGPAGELLQGIEGLASERGLIVVDAASGATRLPGLFAGGDCVNGGGEVVEAVQHGKVAARGIAAYLESSAG